MHVISYLQVVGDKHGPVTTMFLSDAKGRAYLDEMERLLHVSVRFLHVIRHPLDNIATMAVRAQHRRSFIDEVRSNELELVYTQCTIPKFN